MIHGRWPADGLSESWLPASAAFAQQMRLP